MGLKRSPLKRKKSLRDYCAAKRARAGDRAKPMKRVGKKVSAWDKERAKLKVKFFALGITECELKLEGCWKDNALGFAHAKKRRNLKRHELGEVVLACNPCHDQVEKLPEAQMTVIIRRVIVRRNQMHLRLAHAPPASIGKQNAVVTVRLGPEEDVVWEYTHTTDGSFVSGYQIVPRHPIDETEK